jgi:hypothetical protein
MLVGEIKRKAWPIGEGRRYALGLWAALGEVTVGYAPGTILILPARYRPGRQGCRLAMTCVNAHG